ncbi:MAG: GHKL domain-containing protein [Pseudomonadales bacterium]|nr:GHKL domain-containing protein [Pseudomonadales bacterium]
MSRLKPLLKPTRSLRIRLLAGTLLWVMATIAIAGWGLAELFRRHLAEQFRAGLVVQLDQLTANLAIDQAGQPVLSAPLSDPRLRRPLSGLYWQIDRLGNSQQNALPGVLRSRSLWDTTLTVPDDAPVDGEIHEHQVRTSDGAQLGMIERIVSPAEQPEQSYRLIVAATTNLITEPAERFNGMLMWSLGSLGIGLLAAAIAQVLIGLRPLGHLRRKLAELREGTAQNIGGSFPAEIQPLVDDFNDVLSHNARIVAHARIQAGNLAHAVKTPLSVLANAASSPDPQLPQLVKEQVAAAQRQVDYHLARARAAGSSDIPGVRSPVRPVVESLIRVMNHVYRDKDISASLDTGDIEPLFWGEEQDLQEILGNLLDNAWKWAHNCVSIQCRSDGNALTVLIDDDGPGLAPELRQAMLTRGMRADERVAGTGLGLAIVSDLVELYHGSINLESSPAGGLRVRLEFGVKNG